MSYNPPAASASTTRQGLIQLATGSEAVTGTDGTKAVTPSTLTSAMAAASVTNDRLTVIWDPIAGAYPTQAVSPPANIKVREFIGPVLPSTAAWNGVVDLYTYANIT